MFVTKFSHSCLLIENNNTFFLIDPGIYSNLHVDHFEKLDYLLVTHEHEDHVDIDFVKKLVIKFPDLIIKSNSSVVDFLKNHSIVSSQDSDERVKLEEIPHERLFDKEPPENFAITIDGILTHVGDSFHYKNHAEVLAFPIQAPWGSYTEAIEKITELSPKKVIPIHDWHWKDEVRRSMQKRAHKYLWDHGIDLIPLEDRQRIEV